MPFRAALKVPDPKGVAFRALAPEGTKMQFDRSSLLISNAKGITTIKISATDYTAFKSAIWPSLKNLDLILGIQRGIGEKNA